VSHRPQICNYEGSDYRSRFWGNRGREYEDLSERIALRRLMPPTGDTLIDIGAGFGRLADEFHGYRRVVLFDYSRSMLSEAKEHLGEDPKYIFVAGNWYQMPFVPALFDTMVQIRTIHHAADVPALLDQLIRIARPTGQYILEFASKHHIKAIFRYWFGRQAWSPFQLEPLEFVELNYDFHPRWMKHKLREAGFQISRTLAVSYFRIGLLKKLTPAPILASMDGLVQRTGKWWQLSPSIFVAGKAPSSGRLPPVGAFFACPICQTPITETEEEALICGHSTCGRRWPIENGIYNFKEP